VTRPLADARLREMRRTDGPEVLMRTTTLGWSAAGIVAGGAVAWLAATAAHDRTPAPTFDDPAPELARLRADIDRQADELARLRADLDRLAADGARLRAAQESAPKPAPATEPARPSDAAVEQLRADVSEIAERVARVERTTAPTPEPAAAPSPGDADARRRKQALERLRSVTDGRRFVAVEDARTDLVRMGDDAVPDVLALLDSGLEQDWGGRFETRGLHVDGYPGLRMVLLDVLRQIGTPASKKAFVDAIGRSEHVRDLWALKLYWGTTDPALADGVAAVAPRLLRLVAKAGLPAAVGDQPDSPVHNLLWWLYLHPAADLAGPLEEIVVQGRPSGTWNEQTFESTFSLLARLAPEKAAEDALALQERNPAKREVVELSGKLFCPNTLRARYFTTLFARGTFTPQVRLELYEKMYGDLWRDKDMDHAAQVADARPYIDFLERRIEAETDANAKRVLEESLSRLRSQCAASEK
jgi:hypothetical protein